MASIQQWVNLDPADAKLRKVPGEGTIPPERCGPVITLRAKINRKKRGKKIYWGVQLGDKNISPNPDPANQKWHHNASKGGFSAPGFYEKLVRTNRKGWSVTSFTLSECGGDEFTIKAYTKTKKGKIKKELKSSTYVVWRQLYYQVTHMGPSVGHTALPAIADIAWGDVKGEYDDSRKPHNIRLSEVPPTTAQITRHRSLYNEDMIARTGLEGYDRAMEPLVTKISLVDLLAEKGVMKHRFEVVKEGTTYPLELDYLLFDLNSADDKDDWFCSISAHRKDEASQTFPLGRADVTRAGPATVQLSVAHIPKRHLFDFFRKATVELQVYVFYNWTLGFSWYNGVWVNNAVADDSTSPPTIASEPMRNKVATMVHEIGHAIGMVPAASPYNYPSWHGHEGNHCWNGAKDPSTFPASEPYYAPTGAICTMFGDGSSNTHHFCDVCSPFVRSCKPEVDGNFKKNLMMRADITTW